MKFRVPYILFVLLLFSSCTGQNSTDSGPEFPENPASVLAIGDTVKGLPDGLTVIFQDAQGNHWFGGSEEGAYRYDGQSLLRFTKADGLCSHSVLGIQEDKAGNIYFDTQDGVSKFDGEGFSTLEAVESGPYPNGWKLEAGDLWFRMGWDHKGPYRYDGNSLFHLEFPKTYLADEFYAQYPGAPYNPYGIYSMYTDRRGHLWFGTAALGTCRFDGHTAGWIYEETMSKAPNGGDFGIRSIIEDREGNFWFCNTRHRYEVFAETLEKRGTELVKYERHDGLGQVNGDGETEFPFFMSVVEGENGDLWMATGDEGVLCKRGEELIHYPVRDGERLVQLFSIYKDKQKVLWVCSWQAGIFRFNGKTFDKFSG